MPIAERFPLVVLIRYRGDWRPDLRDLPLYVESVTRTNFLFVRVVGDTGKVRAWYVLNANDCHPLESAEWWDSLLASVDAETGEPVYAVDCADDGTCRVCGAPCGSTHQHDCPVAAL